MKQVGCTQFPPQPTELAHLNPYVAASTWSRSDDGTLSLAELLK
jgi:hypothetical protein